jgi:hypothetical protein
MPLIESSRKYIGQSLLVLPYYGNGWTRPDLGGPPPEPNGHIGPEPFRIEVQELILLGNQLQGASGYIKQADHVLDKHWCAFFLRTLDECDFTEKPGHYMIWIAPERLPVQPSPDKALYQWVAFESRSPCLCGYGMVAEESRYMGQFYSLTMTTRRTLLGHH